jgi:hypothetical protein
MKTYPVVNDKKDRTPIFQIESAQIGSANAVQVLTQIEGVTDVQLRKMFSKSSDIHVTFKYMGQPYIVWEPFGDNSRYWIGPADMVEGAEDVPDIQHPSDLARLEEAFKRYKVPFHRAFLDDLITLRFITRFLRKRS